MKPAVETFEHKRILSMVYEDLIEFLRALRKRDYPEAHRMAERLSRMSAELNEGQPSERRTRDPSGRR